MQRRFSIDEIKIPAKEPVLDKAGFLAETFYKVHCEKINSIKNLITRLPDIGEIFLLSTLNSFNAFTFVPFIIKNCGVIDELIITTYSINIRIIDALIKQIDLGNIRKVDLLISYSLKARLPKVYDHLSALETNRKFSCTFVLTTILTNIKNLNKIQLLIITQVIKLIPRFYTTFFHYSFIFTCLTLNINLFLCKVLNYTT